ncbi:NADH-quinone oxidoreductase subunit NuoE [Deltaproteobacteria bacterium Smac51]|nr:NADH-quinone oxidoreductase subunit NuoE [Deltaproteobacteria bacterium Smac51]
MNPLEDLLQSRPGEARQLLPLLQLIQAHYRYLPEEALRAVAEKLELPLSRVFAVATFYSALSLRPKGETVVKVCCGTACHLRGSETLIASLEKELGIKLGETTPDGSHTLESVNCLGACALAPVVMVGDETHGNVPAASARHLLGKVK